jgi:predicted PurR-regulated permease PerM
MNINNLNTTNRLLLIIAVPVVFYILKVLSFIFVPLVLAVFLALLFMPMLRWLNKRKVPKYLSLGMVIVIIISSLFVTVKVVQLSGKEIIKDKSAIYHKLDDKVGDLIIPLAETMGIETDTHSSAIKSILSNQQVKDTLYANFGMTFTLLQKSLTLILMMLFFLVLLLAGSLNFKQIMQDTMFNRPTQAIKTFMAIEKSVARFILVKFLVSLFTGIGFSVVCIIFDISFPLFWGLFAFAINFLQMIGSVISTVVASLFAIVEIAAPGTVLIVILLFTAVQVVFGAVLEPILMGKSFSINIVSILVMLMFWGFLWGIPGLILSIPLTVLIKTLLEQFPNTRVMAKLMS